MKMLIADVVVGKRVRKRLGGMDGLAASMKELGQLQPILVDGEGKLLAGQRRLEAAKVLGWEKIEVYRVSGFEDALERLKAERDENVQREELAPSECVVLSERLEKLIKPKAAEREKAGKSVDGKAGGRGRKKPSVKVTQGLGKTRDQVAEAVGMSFLTLDKARVVVAASAANPALKPVVEKMDETGNVNKAFRDVKKVETEAKRAEAVKCVKEIHSQILVGDFRVRGAEIPDGSIDLIFTDPPYDRKSVGLYGHLADFAAAKLVEGGSLITYCGHYLVPEILPLMTGSLRFWWMLACVHSGSVAQMREYGIKVHWKPMLWFVKGTRRDKETWIEDVVSGGKEKDHHEWQQAESEAAYYIERLCPKDGCVVDPFLGGGTTAAAARSLGRRWIGIEIDEVSAKAASKRLEV